MSVLREPAYPATRANTMIQLHENSGRSSVRGSLARHYPLASVIVTYYAGDFHQADHASYLLRVNLTFSYQQFRGVAVSRNQLHLRCFPGRVGFDFLARTLVLSSPSSPSRYKPAGGWAISRSNSGRLLLIYSIYFIQIPLILSGSAKARKLYALKSIDIRTILCQYTYTLYKRALTVHNIPVQTSH